MSGISWQMALLLLCLLILAVDCIVGNIQDWRKRRAAHITHKHLRRFGLSGVRGTKDRFLS